jgi:hypothetical protein
MEDFLLGLVGGDEHYAIQHVHVYYVLPG